MNLSFFHPLDVLSKHIINIAMGETVEIKTPN